MTWWTGELAATYGNIAQWVGGIATVLAVLVALFKEQFLHWYNRPYLKVRILQHAPDCHQSTWRYSVQRVALTYVNARCYFLRMWIENTGKARAEQVQVYADRLLHRRADGSFAPVTNFLPMNLVWSHPRPTPTGQEIFAEGISRGMGKHCDIGHIVEPSSKKDLAEELPGVADDVPVLALEVEFRSNTLSHLVPPGEYQLHLKIAAANCPPRTAIVHLVLKGQWFNDETEMFARGVGITVSDG